jgi:hypothetical protein
VSVPTPYDKDLAAINAELARSTLVYGGEGKKTADMRKVTEAAALPAGAAADRAGFAGKSGRAASYDLLDAIKAKEVKLDDLKEGELPKELQKLTPKERQAYLDKLEKRRGELNKQARELDKKRSDFIQEKLKEKKAGKDSFDNQVLEILRKQAKKHDIGY